MTVRASLLFAACISCVVACSTTETHESCTDCGDSSPVAEAPPYELAAAAVDAAGDVFVLGEEWVDDLGAMQMVIEKFDPAGVSAWKLGFGSAIGGYDLAVALDGGLYVAGDLRAPFEVAGETVTPIGGADAMVLRLDADGAPIWMRHFGSAATFFQEGFESPDATRPAAARGERIAVGANGDVALDGSFEVEMDVDGIQLGSGDDATLSDMFVLKLDAEGDALWARRGGPQAGQNGELLIDGDDVLVGWWTSSVYGGIGVDRIDAMGEHTASAGGLGGMYLSNARTALGSDGVLYVAAAANQAFENQPSGVALAAFDTVTTTGAAELWHERLTSKSDQLVGVAVDASGEVLLGSVCSGPVKFDGAVAMAAPHDLCVARVASSSDAPTLTRTAAPAGAVVHAILAASTGEAIFVGTKTAAAGESPVFVQRVAP